MLIRSLIGAMALLMVTLAPAETRSSGAPLQAIAKLDVPRYMGRWYEIAKLPNWFQRKCVADTSATYRLLPDGRVEVLNQCRKDNGQMDQALGMARQIGPAHSATLQVRFAPSWLSVLPFVWGDYWVIDLDEGYELVAVSEPKRRYLWILSRTPGVDEVRYSALLARLQAMGLDVRQLERTRHSPH